MRLSPALEIYSDTLGDARAAWNVCVLVLLGLSWRKERPQVSVLLCGPLRYFTWAISAQLILH